LKEFNEENVMLKRIEDENNLSNNSFSKKSSYDCLFEKLYKFK
jgi:hypothetical protein